MIWGGKKAHLLENKNYKRYCRNNARCQFSFFIFHPPKKQ